MGLLPNRRYAFVGQGQTVINTVAVASGIGMLLLGYDQGVMAGLIGSEGTPFSNTFDNPDSTTLGLMVAIYEIGCFVGAIFSFVWGDHFSRRTCMIAGVFIMLVGATLQTVAHKMAHLIAGRIITGLGNGLNFSAIPTWASEISGHEERGRFAAFNSWLIIWGVVIAYWVDYGCANYTTDMQFRFPIALQMLFGLIMAVMVVSVTGLFNSILHTQELEKHTDGEFSYAELFQGGRMQNWRRMALCAGIMAFQQLSGINLLTYYISYVLENSVGLSHNMSLLVGGLNGIEYLVAAMIPIWTIDRIGRRKLLLLSAAGQAIFMAVLAGAIWYVTKKPDGPGSYAMGIVAVACFFLFNTFYAQGFLAIPYFYPAEITNLRTRSRGVSLSVMSNWIFTFLVVMVTPICTTNIGWRTYIIFAVLNASFVPTIYFFLPETAGLSLEALDDIFNCGGITRGVLNKQHRRAMLELSRQQLTENPSGNEHKDFVGEKEAMVEKVEGMAQAP